ncbi:MAG: ThiF family adenylyltransferase [Deltaproteobacteria bacterium]|nr:ThiF family adenylyltransferase [Deltaproteobacteria bacterium]
MEETEQGKRANEPGQREPVGGVCLDDLAYLSDYLGDSQLVIEDDALLEWAHSSRISPRDAQIEALQRRIIPLRYAKNFNALTLAEQRHICESRVLVCGCGGLGGVIINLLARAGVGTLRLVDGAVFVPSNLNCHWFCDTQELSRPKAEVAGARVRAINPLTEVEVFSTVMDEDNVGALIGGMGLVIDATDNLPGSLLLAEAAKHMRVPFIHTAAAGWWGQVSTFLPESFLNLHDIYGPREEGNSAEDMTGVLSPAPAAIASLASFEAIRLLSGRNSAYTDQLLYLDGESGRMDVIPLG